MPQQVRLPDGTVVDIPDDATPQQRAQIAAAVQERFGGGQEPQATAPPAFANPFATDEWLGGSGLEAGLGSLPEPSEDYGTEEDGTILGSAWEGIKSIPRGARQFALMAQQGWEGIRTPGEDTEREKELRQRLQDLMMEIDPKYRDANLVHLGMGLGQVGGMMGLGAAATALGAGSLGAAAVAGTATALMGAGEQAGRIAEFEERTGEDVSDRKEIMSLGLGLGIGLSELAPLGKYARGIGLGRKAAKEAGEKVVDKAADMTWSQIGQSAFRQAAEEAAQEGVAGFSQSAVARYMYDEDALQDAGVEALREALIGGQVGAVTDVMLKMGTRAVANVRGRRGDYDMNERVSKRFWERAGRGDFNEAEVERLITGPDTEGIRAAIEQRKKTVTDDVTKRYAAGSLNNDEALAAIEEGHAAIDADTIGELEAALEEEQGLQELRASMFEFNEDGTLRRDEDGAPVRRQGEGTLEWVNEQQAAAEMAQAEADEQAGVITKEELDKVRAEATDRTGNYKRQMDILAAAFAAKELGFSGRQLQEETAQAQLDELQETILEEEVVTEEDQAAFDEQNLPEPLAEVSLENIPPSEGVQLGALANQLEVRIRPSTKSKMIETEGQVNARRGQFGAQIAPLRNKVVKTRKELTGLATEEVVADPVTGEQTVRWVPKTLDSSKDQQATARNREVLEGEIGELQEAIDINVAAGMIDPATGAVIDKIEAGRDGTPKEGEMIDGRPADRDDVLAQRSAAREYNKATKELAKKQEQLAKQVTTTQKVDILATRLANEQAALDTREGGAVAIEETTLGALVEEGDPSATAEFNREMDAINAVPVPPEAEGAEASWKQALILSLTDRKKERLASGMSMLESDEYLARELNDTRTREHGREVAIDDEVRGGLFELEQYLNSPEQRNAYRAFVEAFRQNPKAKISASEATDILRGVFGGRGLNLRWETPEGTTKEAVAVPDARTEPRAPRDTLAKEERGLEAEGIARGERHIEDALDSILGLSSVDSIDQAIEEVGRPKHPKVHWPGVPIIAQTREVWNKITKDLESSNYEITEDILSRTLRAKNFKAPKNLVKTDFFKSLIEDTLGPTDRTWHELIRGQKEAVFARLMKMSAAPDTTPEGKQRKQEEKIISKELQGSPLAAGKTKPQVRHETEAIVEAEKSLNRFKIALKKALTKRGLGDLAVRLTADFGDVMAEVKDVVVNGVFELETDNLGNVVIDEDGKPKVAKDKQGRPIYRPAYKGGAVASLQKYGTRIAFNLSQIASSYPNGIETDVETLIDNVLAHEGAHTHFIRDDLNTSDRRALDRYGRKAVPKEVNKAAHAKGLSWRAYVKESYPHLDGDALTEETSVHILDALAQDKIPAARAVGLIGKIKRQLQNQFGALTSAAREADILPVLQVFEKIQNVDVMKQRAEKRATAGGVQSLQFIERAKPEDAKVLADAIKEGDHKKIEQAIDRILESKMEFSDDRTPLERLQESLVSELRARREIDTNPDRVVAPVLNAKAIEDGDIDPESLNAAFRFIDGREPAYRMPASEQEMRLFRFGKSTVALSDADEAFSQEIADSNRVARSADPGTQVVGALDYHNFMQDGKYVGNEADFREMMRYTKAEAFRKRYLDKRLANWKSSKRAWKREIAKYGEVLGRLAENSAVAAWRFADNAQNFIPGVMQHGMIVYEEGGFKLTKLENAKGEPVKGLYQIFEPLVEMGEAAQEQATYYMTALRIVDIRNRREAARAALQSEINNPNATPESIRELRQDVGEWEVAYNRANKMGPKGRFFPHAEAQKAIDTVNAADTPLRSALVKFAEEYSDFNQHLIDFAVSTGQLTQARADVMKQLRYVPFYRDQGWDNTDPMKNRQNDTLDKSNKDAAAETVKTRGAPLIDESLMGSMDPINSDIFGNITRNVSALIRDGMVNIATTRSMRDEVANGTAVEIVYPSAAQLARQEYLTKKEKKDQAEKDELRDLTNEITRLNDEAAILNDELTRRGFSDIQVTAKGVSTDINLENRKSEIAEHGVSKVYRVMDPELSRSIMDIGFSPQQAIEDFFSKTLQIKNEKMSKGLTKLVVGSSRFLREMVTRSPPFMIKNIIRDSFQASVTYGGGPALIFKAFRNALLDPNILQKAEEVGLGIAVDMTPDPKRAEEVLISMGKRKKRSLANPLDWGVMAWDKLGHFSKRTEVATRMAVYDTTMARTDGNAAEALHQAIEIINYGRRGSSRMFSTLAAMAPFLNGRVQGTDVVIRTHAGAMDAPGLFGEEGTMTDGATERAWRIATAVRRGSLFVAGTMMYYLMVRDDEEYKNAREDMKNDWWLIPMGKGRPGFKVPIPFEVGVLYKVIPEQMMRMIDEEEHDARDVRDELKRQLVATLRFDLRPQVVRPVIDAMTNKDAYQRDQIVPQWMEDTVAASEQYNPYTSMVTRLIGDSLDEIPLVKNMDFLTSPMKLEYMLRQYMGTLGSYAMITADAVTRNVMSENLVGTAADFPPFGGGLDNNTWVNMPVIGDLFYDPAKGGGYQEDLYETVENMNKLVTTLGQIEENRGREAARDFEAEHKGMFDAKNRLAYFERRMTHYREERDRLFKRTDLSNDDKRRQLYRMFEVRDDMLAEMVKIMADIREERSTMDAILGTGP